ncbi:YdeI/OmpD-associated family protein [Maribacter halichondriae]|uniref:YdeI/OmpD-associated family protein n=1 Tax=Maribacter halichondriae TaxID=2980554 RepID=UPI0023584656|nr:YdeI/OmpD-associated family protein [Maribacter sp. Hal144]
MNKIPELYFKNDTEFREWLHENHAEIDGIYLIFYTIAHENDSMRWEEAVQVAICYGWIDSTVKSLGDGKRRQYFCPRKPKSVWSKVNKNYIKNLSKKGLMHKSGLEAIKIAKENGSWTALDDVENGMVPEDLQKAFDSNPKAFKNYKKFTRGQRKSYLYWLNQAKREETRQKRIEEIIRLCEAGIKSRNTR